MGLGSNVHDRLENLREAVRKLKKKPGIEVTKISGIYETEPVGGPGQLMYFNAAVEIKTKLQAEELLKVCLEIEDGMGRSRQLKWGPRNIDIDLLLYGDVILNKPDITVPHPLMHTRGFVLYPLSEIAPDIVHPAIHVSVRNLKNKTESKGITRLQDVNLDE